VPAGPSARGAARIWLLERQPGDLGPLEAVLGDSGIACLRTVQAALPTAPAPDAVVLSLGPDLTALLGRLMRSWPGYRPPLLGHAPERDDLTLSRGLALGCCELLHDALPPATVAAVVARAAELGLLRRELAGRLALLESFATAPAEDPAPAALPPSLLLVGPATGEQVEIARAVGQARIAYGRPSAEVMRDRFDLVIRTRQEDGPGLPAQRLGDAVLLATTSDEDGEPVTIGTVDGEGRPLLAPCGDPFVLRMHLGFWTAYARARRRLRALPEADCHALARDELTGLGNFAYFASYLDAVGGQGSEVPLLAIGLPSLERINREDGFAAGNRLLREAGRLLRNHCRAADLLARIGGSFLCVPSAAQRETLPAMAARLAATLRRLPGPPPMVVTSTARRGEAATRTIHRVRRELRSELARVA